MRKIGIYSGSFDPVHEGHVSFALEAIKQCGLDKVFFLVEPRPRRKQGVKALEHRQAMVRLAIRNQPKLASIMIDQSRFTAVDTLPVLKNRFGGAELYMLFGDDMLSHFADWPQVDELIRDLKFAIGLRKYSAPQVNRLLETVRLTRGLDMDYHLFEVENAKFSSSAIRLKFKRGQTPEGLHPAVNDYIKEHGLYASSKLGS